MNFLANPVYQNKRPCGHKKEWDIAICSNIDGSKDYRTEWSKPGKERQIYDSTYMWNLKTNTDDLTYITEIDSQIKKANLWLPKWKEKGRDKLGVWD